MFQSLFSPSKTKTVRKVGVMRDVIVKIVVTDGRKCVIHALIVRHATTRRTVLTDGQTTFEVD